MLEAFKLFPSYLFIITIIFVIIPTILSAFLRIYLYQNLRNLESKTRRLVNNEARGKQPKIVTELERKINNISDNLENLNTVALIDTLYYQETVSILKKKISYEEVEYITKMIPNLLLAFGLLGTFLGITLNLSSISQIINQGGSDIADLTSRLQNPLQSMGIAFITSLIGLFCASILTVINIICNVGLEKNYLLNNLENYVDNDYKKKVDKSQKLQDILNNTLGKMADKQTEFLIRFHENVGQVLERTFKQAADKIADENEKSQKIITQLYENLFDACSLISNGANVFQLSTKSLENQVESLQRMMPILRQNIESFDHSANLILTASSRIEASKFSENLEKITDNLAQTQEAFTASTKELTKGVIIFNNDSKKATNLALNIYEELKKASESLEESSVLFADSATTIKESQFSEKLVVSTNNLMAIQQPLLEMIKILNQTIKPLEMNIKTFDLSIDKMIKVTPNYEQFKNAIEKLEESAVIFTDSANTIKESQFSEQLMMATNNLMAIQQPLLEMIKILNQTIQPLEGNIQTFNLSVEKMAEVTPDYQQFKGAIELLDKSANIFINSAEAIKETKFNDGLAETTNNLGKIQSIFVNAIKQLNEIVKPLAVNIKTLEVSSDKMAQLAQNVNKIESNINTINARYLEMTNVSREIVLKLGENTVKNNERYSEMMNISRDTLLKLGEISVITKNSYQQIIDEITKVTQKKTRIKFR